MGSKGDGDKGLEQLRLYRAFAERAGRQALRPTTYNQADRDGLWRRVLEALRKAAATRSAMSWNFLASEASSRSSSGKTAMWTADSSAPIRGSGIREKDLRFASCGLIESGSQ